MASFTTDGSVNTLSNNLAAIASRFSSTGDLAGQFSFFQTTGNDAYYLFISDGIAGISSGDVIAHLQGITSINAITISQGNLAILS